MNNDKSNNKLFTKESFELLLSLMRRERIILKRFYNSKYPQFKEGIRCYGIDEQNTYYYMITISKEENTPEKKNKYYNDIKPYIEQINKKGGKINGLHILFDIQ